MCKRDAFRVFVTGDDWYGATVDGRITDDLIGKMLREGIAVMVPDRLRRSNLGLVCTLWMSELERSWIRCCEAMLVLPGDGICREQDIDHAAEVSVPRFDDVDALIEYYHRTGSYE